MPEYGFPRTRVFSYQDRIVVAYFTQCKRVAEETDCSILNFGIVSKKNLY